MQENVINKIYIDGEFVTPHGTELADLFNPATGKVIGQVQLADEVDTEAAVAAAKRALSAWSATSKEERIDALRRLQAAVAARRNEMLDSAVVEYGAPLRNEWMVDTAVSAFAAMITTLEGFDYGRVMFVDDGHRASHELVESPGSSTIQRQVRDGRRFRAVKVALEPRSLECSLRELGWVIEVKPLAGPLFS